MIISVSIPACIANQNLGYKGLFELFFCFYQSYSTLYYQVLTSFKDQCRDVQYEIEDSNVYNRSIEISTAYAMIDQFRSEVDQLQTESQVKSNFPDFPFFRSFTFSPIKKDFLLNDKMTLPGCPN